MTRPRVTRGLEAWLAVCAALALELAGALLLARGQGAAAVRQSVRMALPFGVLVAIPAALALSTLLDALGRRSAWFVDAFRLRLGRSRLAIVATMLAAFGAFEGTAAVLGHPAPLLALTSRLAARTPFARLASPRHASGIVPDAPSGSALTASSAAPAPTAQAAASEPGTPRSLAGRLADPDTRVRRVAAEALFELALRGDIAAEEDEAAIARTLRGVLADDADETVRRWAALSLTRLGQGASLTFDLIASDEQDWKRLAALTLAEAGDARGFEVLLAWWNAAFPAFGDPRESMPPDRGERIAHVLARSKRKQALEPLTRGLADPRLRAPVARALAELGDREGRHAMAARLNVEPEPDVRAVLARSIAALHGRTELLAPLAHYLATPVPIPGGLELAAKSELLLWMGGPNKYELPRLRRFATSGVSVSVLVPGRGNGSGVRVLVRGRSTDGAPGEVRIGVRPGRPNVEDRTSAVPLSVPRLEGEQAVTFTFERREMQELHRTFPSSIPVPTGQGVDVIVYATQNVEIDCFGILPLVDDGPVPRPEP